MELLCNEYEDGDGEVLDISKENISCLVSDCLDDSPTSVPLSSLRDCPQPALDTDKSNVIRTQ